MKLWKFYALWVTRNGQHLWDGPFDTRKQAQGTLDQTLECTHKIIVERSVEE